MSASRLDASTASGRRRIESNPGRSSDPDHGALRFAEEPTLADARRAGGRFRG